MNDTPAKLTLAQLVESYKRTVVKVALEAHKGWGGLQAAADELGITRKSLWELRIKYDLNEDGSDRVVAPR